MFKDMKLRSRMLLGYTSALAIIMIALIFGIVGLILNVAAFEDYADLTEDIDQARAIEMNLYESRLSYKYYMSSGDRDSIDAFDFAYLSMTNNISELRKSAPSYVNDKQYKGELQTIELGLNEYKNDFSDVRRIENGLIVTYNDLATRGYLMLDHLTLIKEVAYINGDDAIHHLAASALQNLLTARLHATKFFDFHTQDEYDAYIKSYGVFMLNINDMQYTPNSTDYSTDYSVVVDNVIPYRDGMEVLYNGVVEIDDIEDYMDKAGPDISGHIERIIATIVGESLLQQEAIASNNMRWVIEMIALTLIAIGVFFFVAYKILRLVLTPIHSLTDAFKDITEAETNTNFRLPVVGEDELGAMSNAFNRFMVKLSTLMEDINYQNKLKTAQNSLFDLSRDENGLEHMSEVLLAFMVEHVNGLVGRLYLTSSEDPDYFIATATYGIDLNKKDCKIRRMEGIIGNSISTKKITTMHQIPEDYLAITTGLGSTIPRHIMVLPCTYNGQTNCVIEIGQIDAFSATDLLILEGLAGVVGNIVHSTGLREDMSVLLEKTIQQSEELQSQQEELRQSNEELEEQTKALKESGQRLQAQQEELRVSNEELEERSKQLELQKAALDEKNKAIMISQDEILEKAYALEQANRYKSEFLANMSHELRTPLNSILVLSQLLGTRNNTKPLSEKETKFADTIHTSGTDLLTLINGVLDLSKVEAGRLELLPEEIQLSEIVSECEHLFAPVAEIKDIEFHTHIDENLKQFIVTDRVRLSQIIKNLISNAIKFTHDGHVELMLRKPSQFECEYTGYNDKDYMTIAVSDTGIGIEADKKEVIFEAFRQEDGTTSRTYGGTGLGLTISLELAGLLGGDIVLESEVGVGSQFILIIPIEYKDEISVIKSDTRAFEKVAAIERPRLQEDKTKEEATRQGDTQLFEVDGSGKALLIIEEDETFATILASLAEEKGYKAIISGTGIEGLKIAKDIKPAAIILDMGLPDIDGLEVARKLEANDLTSDIPIHVISGKDQVLDEHMPKSIIGFLKKPVDIKTIYKTLAKIENLNHKGLKKLLVVGQCGGESFDHFTNLGQVEVVKVETGKVALEAIKQTAYGCIVLDTKLEDMTGMDFITAAHDQLEYKIPIVIYTEEDVNFDEYDHMNQYAESIIIKSEKSRERLTDEVSLFLHGMTKTIEQYEGSVTKTLKANVKNQIDAKNQMLGKRVLLVDDDERNVFALMHALEQYGFEVVIAKDGQSAIDRFKENKQLDMILMDIMMPKMDGYEAIKHIRNLGNGKKIPIIALTAKAMVEDREKCIKAGANDYMTKPIDVEKLLSLIKVWMT